MKYQFILDIFLFLLLITAVIFLIYNIIIFYNSGFEKGFSSGFETGFNNRLISCNGYLISSTNKATNKTGVFNGSS